MENPVAPEDGERYQSYRQAEGKGQAFNRIDLSPLKEYIAPGKAGHKKNKYRAEDDSHNIACIHRLVASLVLINDGIIVIDHLKVFVIELLKSKIAVIGVLGIEDIDW